ncbi:MAG: glutamyl-tRNA reductase [Anaerolineales bacterium]
MHLLCLGLSHHTTPVELRERLNYSRLALEAVLARFGYEQATRPAHVTELVILSTCNRLELYAVAQTEQCDALAEFLSESSGVPRADFEAHLYWHIQAEAVGHLGRVAAGLDSMILGEPQILGQVVEAYEAALGQGAVGPVLSALFRAAIHVGKRARTETGISRNPATISSVAVKLAEAVVGDLTSARVLIVGAGEMAELAVEALRARGTRHVTVVNRTRERATLLAERWGANALTFEQLTEALAEADIVITSAGAPHVIITADLARTALAPRPHRPLVCIDIAVPRNVDPDVRHLPNVHCYDIDDLEGQLNGARAERQQEVPRVEAIVAEEAGAFLNWLRGLEITPLIADLHAKADTIRRAEVERTLRRLPHIGEVERRQIETMTEALVNKLLHDPTLRLKAEAGNGHAAKYAAALRYLFALND